MALETKYKQFLTRPTAEALAVDASLVYIPTLTTIREPNAILKHIRSQDQQLQKKNEVVLNTLETATGLCIETETTLQFVSGGGVYLPYMDDNLLSDKIVTLVMVHVVSFNASGQIQQVRMFWDQGSLLKSVDVIGRTGRNWPLHTGEDQARTIRACAVTAPQVTTTPAKDTTHRQSSTRTSNLDTMMDILSPPRTLDFTDSPKNLIAPRESSKPEARDYGELFASAETVANSPSPTKRLQKSSQLRSGAGKNFAPNRLFDQDDSSSKPPSPSIKTNPKKFNHFEFNEQAPIVKAMPTRTNKFASQWDFADFSTPAKNVVRTQPHMMRHSGWDNKEENTWPATAADERAMTKPRPDTASHFELNGVTPQGEKKINIDDKDVEHEEPVNDRVLGNITNVEQNRRNFGNHWEMTDNRDVIDKTMSDENARTKPLTEAKKKAVKVMEPSWAMYDDAPPQVKGIKIAGNGMGSRIGVVEEPAQPAKGIKIAGNGMGGRNDRSSLWEF